MGLSKGWLLQVGAEGWCGTVGCDLLMCRRPAQQGLLHGQALRHPCSAPLYPVPPLLVQAPLTVLLYVSAARRVQAFVAAEAIKEAFCVRPSLPPAAAQGMLSCGSAVQPCSGGGEGHAAGRAAAQEAGPPAAVAAGAAAQAHVATSGRSLLSVTLSTGAAAAECSSRAAAAGQDAAAAGGAAGDSINPQLAQQQQQQQAPQGQQQAPQAQQVQQQPALALPPLELDRSQRVRAVCGVRLMWVSLEARRRGLASRLLDCCRSHFMPGYVLPRHELAFRCVQAAGCLDEWDGWGCLI